LAKGTMQNDAPMRGRVSEGKRFESRKMIRFSTRKKKRKKAVQRGERCRQKMPLGGKGKTQMQREITPIKIWDGKSPMGAQKSTVTVENQQGLPRLVGKVWKKVAADKGTLKGFLETCRKRRKTVQLLPGETKEWPAEDHRIGQEKRKSGAKIGGL